MTKQNSTDRSTRWLETLPPQWNARPLKAMARLVTGITPPTDDASNYAEGDGFPWIRPDDLNQSGAPTTATKFLSEKGCLSVRSVPALSTLICCIGTIGKLGYVTEPASTNQQITSAVFHQDPRYYYYALLAAQPELELASTGNVLRILNSERLGAILLPLPPKGLGSAIAAFLDRETAKIDALVEEQKRLIDLLKVKRQAVISHAVTKGLNPDAPMKDSGIDWLGQVPEHWEIRSISSISTKITNGYVGPTRDILVEDGVRYLQSLHIKANRILFESPYFVTEKWSKNHAKSILQRGDVLVVQTGDIGQVAVVTDEFVGCNCHALIIISPVHEVVMGDWLSWVLNSSYGLNSLLAIRTGALHPHLNCGNVKTVVVPVPELEEQALVVDYLQRELPKFDDLILAAEHMTSILHERRAALISAAVTGKIDVRALVEVEDAA